MNALTTREHKEEEHVIPNEEKFSSIFKKKSICLLHLYCLESEVLYEFTDPKPNTAQTMTVIVPLML